MIHWSLNGLVHSWRLINLVMEVEPHDPVTTQRFRLQIALTWLWGLSLQHMKFGRCIQTTACISDNVQVLSQRAGAGPDSASKIQVLLGFSSVVAHMPCMGFIPSITRKIKIIQVLLLIPLGWEPAVSNAAQKCFQKHWNGSSQEVGWGVGKRLPEAEVSLPG